MVNDLHLELRVLTYMSMTLRIAKISDGARIVLKLSGRIQARDIDELHEQIGGRTRETVLDLQEVTLVDVEVVRFLGLCESKGVELAHCSPYIREWVFREQVAGEEN
jgi:anti-anti-sigma regulatory factor